MDPAHWNEIKRIFQEASDLAPAERPRFLKNSCGHNADLYREVCALLETDGPESGSLTDVIGNEARLAASAAAPRAGESVGPYRLLEELGQGGMGSVWLAVRDDDEYRKQVAVKLVRHLTPEFLERFRAERQILADLEHANIARLLDGGTSADGHPYLVMEYVDGVPIDQYCDQHQLTLRQRLDLFLPVCRAIDFAHRNLVVHRDIKPSNILVTAAGVPKLLDFGIAKLLPGTAGGESLSQTQTGVKLMTPEYASPEQVRGAPITTATDVYSLGVLLYRILTGHPPYVASDDSIAALQVAICGVEPPSPSSAVTRGVAPGESTQQAAERRSSTVEKLRRDLSGDLDHIVLMALRKEPERRYSSAAAFAQDIQNFLRGLPVLARADTWSYRAGKFVRRNKIAMAFAAVLLLTVIGFSAAVFFQMRRVAEERDNAFRQSRRAEETVAFLLNLFRLGDPGETEGNAITARELLDRGAQQVRDELASQPAVQAPLLEAIGQVYSNLGLFDRAEALLLESIQVCERTQPESSTALTSSLVALGSVYLGKAEYSKAEPLLRRAMDLNARYRGEESTGYARALGMIARLNAESLHYDRALPQYERCLALTRKLYPAESPELAVILNDYGLALYDAKRYEESKRMQREALAIRRKLRPRFHPDISESLNNLGIALNDNAEFREALPVMQEALEVDRKVYGPDHHFVGTDLNNLAMLFQATGDYPKAAEIHREALALRERTLGKSHPLYAVSMANLAKALQGLGEFPEAERLQKEAIKINRRVFGDANPKVAASWNTLGSLYASQADLARAREAYGRALQLYERMEMPHDTERCQTLEGLARVHIRERDGAAAEHLLRESVSMRVKVLGEEHWRVWWAKALLADSLLSQGKLAEARTLAETAQPVLLKARGASSAESKTVARVIADASRAP